MKYDIDLKKKVDTSLFKGINQKTALKFFQKHGFKNLISRFTKKEDNDSIDQSLNKKKQKYYVIQSLDYLANL